MSQRWRVTSSLTQSNWRNFVPLGNILSDVSNVLNPSTCSVEQQAMICITGNGYRFKDSRLQLHLLMDSEETRVDF